MGLTWYNGFSPRVRDDSYRWMKEEIRAGRVPAPSRCGACGETRGHIDYHTESYAVPFGPHIYAFELCFRCHMVLHVRFRAPDLWRRYTEQLEAGAVYRPLMSRREIGRIWEPGWVERPERFGPEREPLAFFRGLTMERGPEGAEQQTRLF